MSLYDKIPHLCTTFDALHAADASTSVYAKLAKHIRDQYGCAPKDWGMSRPIPVAMIAESNGLDDALWVLRNAVKGEQADRDRFMRLLACDFAEHVLPIFEKKYPNDKRPHEAIRMGRLFAEGKCTAEDLIIARRTAAAAAAAADAYAAAADAYADAAYADAAYADATAADATAATDAYAYAYAAYADAAYAAAYAAATATYAAAAANAAYAAATATATTATAAAYAADATATTATAARLTEKQWQLGALQAALTAEGVRVASTFSKGSDADMEAS
jgi:hypothetical protein